MEMHARPQATSLFKFVVVSFMEAISLNQQEQLIAQVPELEAFPRPCDVHTDAELDAALLGR
eukprot:1909440-Amphidinium_carterae.1